MPDADVVYNATFQGFINHSTLWTHSIFVYLAVGAAWLVLYLSRRAYYWQLVIGFITIGGLSHIVLDLMSHGTPLFYPVSTWYVGMASQRVIIGGFWAYITDPIFLLEPLLIAAALCHLIWHLPIRENFRRVGVGVVGVSFAAFAIAFLTWLPEMQSAVLTNIISE